MIFALKNLVLYLLNLGLIVRFGERYIRSKTWDITTTKILGWVLNIDLRSFFKTPLKQATDPLTYNYGKKSMR